MTPALSVEPLFAHNARAWLRAWLALQGAALVIAMLVAYDESRARGPVSWARIAVFVATLVATHVIAVRAYDRILERRWTLLVFLPFCWLVVLWGTTLHRAFAMLLFGAVLQGFIFLPFAWAAVILSGLTLMLAGSIAWGSRTQDGSLVVTRVVAVLGMGLTMGLVLLYIHRANREATVRRKLIEQLDAAQRDLADRAREAGVMEERQRLAHDIHDTLAQGFASVIRHLETVELALPSTPALPDEPWPAHVRTHVGHAQSVSRSSLAEIRRLVHALRPTELSQAPLAAALERVVHQWGDAHAVRATFTADALPALRQDAEVVLLRATQEALSNVARHANATAVAISLTCIDELVMLTVEDDGVGFASADASGNATLGLSGMRERARRLGGYVLVDSTPGEGTSLTLAMPLTAIGASPRDGEAE